MSSKQRRAKKVQSHRGTIVLWCYGVWGPAKEDSPIKDLKKLLVRPGAYSIPFPKDGNVPKAVLEASEELLLGGLISWKICYSLAEIRAMADEHANPLVASQTIRVPSAKVPQSRN